ncbi:MAG: TraR/DksA C4-type zinc finger protein [bacterium]
MKKENIEKNTEHYKEKLLKLKMKFVNTLNHLEDNNLKKSLKDDDGKIIHMSDMGTDSYDMEFMLNHASSEFDVLYEIDEALEKIKNGDNYGLCEKCNQLIEQKRLDVIPYAKLCLKCKEKEEMETKK